jgi:Na+-transporting methylmalonyl-CoA/oxaloacetate decarboxylase gamma subunit
MYFEPIKFVENLKYMGIGMLGVFIIIAIIIAATYAIGTLTAKTEQRKKNNGEEG